MHTRTNVQHSSQFLPFDLSLSLSLTLFGRCIYSVINSKIALIVLQGVRQ